MSNKLGLDQAIGEKSESYKVTQGTLEKMGLKDIDNIENYIVVYNVEDNTKLDVVYTSGIKYQDKIYYTLSSLQSEIGDET